jgi:glutamine cyclotransferase
MKYLISVVFFIAMIACSNDKKIKELEANNISIIENTTPQPVIKKYQITILDTIPKDTSHYTQGLVFHNKTLYEGTGNLGVSALIKYNSKYQIEKKIRIDDNFFGEGITVFNNKIFQLT